MGQCRYCGEDAGFFSHVHKECEEKHEQGVTTLEDGIRRYLKDAVKVNELRQLVAKVKQDSFVEDAELLFVRILPKFSIT